MSVPGNVTEEGAEEDEEAARERKESGDHQAGSVGERMTIVRSNEGETGEPALVETKGRYEREGGGGGKNKKQEKEGEEEKVGWVMVVEMREEEEEVVVSFLGRLPVPVSVPHA